MADLEPYLYDSGCIGCKLQCNDIHNLSFADDFIFLSESETMLQKILSNLLSYCFYSKLKVNTDKSNSCPKEKESNCPRSYFLI